MNTAILSLIIFSSALLLLYFLYPLFLLMVPKQKTGNLPQEFKDTPVSVFLLSYNGKHYIQQKIESLHSELSNFRDYELIVIDDQSDDGSRELLITLKSDYGYTLILKDHHSGIPHSMNLAVEMAQYNTVVFCDQRQFINEGSLKKLLIPLQSNDVGAVSACIMARDKYGHFSLLRKHENLVKHLESRSGSLLGVYGPLYAIKKDVYINIPENIILDDLYLSLTILTSRKIILQENASIVDDNFNRLYNFCRCKRYLRGLLQILRKSGPLQELPSYRIVMLFWHKYLRLLIPPTAILCYFVTAIYAFTNIYAAGAFISISALLLLSLVVPKINFFNNVFSFFRINIYYFISMISIPYQRIFGRQPNAIRPKKV